MSHFGMGAPLSATCRGSPEKRRYINDIHPEITVAPKNVLWILGWCVCQNAEPFTAVHQQVDRHQFTKASRDHPRGLRLFGQRSRASAAHRSRVRDSCPQRREHALPVAGHGLQRSCSLSRPFGERARRLVYRRPRSTPATVEDGFTVRRGHPPRATLCALSGLQLHVIFACLRHGIGVKGGPTESTREPP